MSTDAAAPDLDQQLGQIQAISQNARTTWFGLIALNLFVGVTLMAHRDADFFARDAATKLPVLNIDVPVVSFFIAAPLLVTAIHVYFQVYLVSLWKALAQVPSGDNGAPIADRVFPWLMSHAALRLRTRLRDDGSTDDQPMGWLVAMVSIALGWLFPVAVLAGLWLRSMPLHSLWITGWIAVCLLVSALVAAAGYRAMRRAMAGNDEGASPNAWLLIWGTVVANILMCVTLETTFATNWLRWPDRSRELSEKMPDWLPSHADVVALLPSRARLAEVRLTPRPRDWKPFWAWLADQRHAHRGEDNRWGDPMQYPPIPTWAEMERWLLLIRILDSPDLRNRDLRDANAYGAFLPGADLRGANLARANFSSAKMEGARLDNANFPNARFDNAWLEGAYLRWAHFGGANFHNAKLTGASLFEAQMPQTNLEQASMEAANLSGARMEGANLSEARMTDANLSGAKMEEAKLLNSRMERANLSGARMQGAILIGAILSGASLTEARMEGAQFIGARMEGANLAGAWMERADLSDVRMKGANLRGVRIWGATLRAARMEGAKLNWSRIEAANLAAAHMQAANLGNAKIAGTSLVGARMDGSDCTNTAFLATLVASANLRCRNLSRAQMQFSVGDNETRLPAGFTIWSCINHRNLSENARNQIDSALEMYPELDDEANVWPPERSEYAAMLFCDPASDDPYRRRPVAVGRPNPMNPH